MCDPILVTLLKMRPHYSQSSRENATPSSGTSPLASYKEINPGAAASSKLYRTFICGNKILTVTRSCHEKLALAYYRDRCTHLCEKKKKTTNKNKNGLAL